MPMALSVRSALALKAARGASIGQRCIFVMAAALSKWRLAALHRHHAMASRGLRLTLRARKCAEKMARSSHAHAGGGGG